MKFEPIGTRYKVAGIMERLSQDDTMPNTRFELASQQFQPIDFTTTLSLRLTSNVNAHLRPHLNGSAPRLVPLHIPLLSHKDHSHSSCATLLQSPDHLISRIQVLPHLRYYLHLPPDTLTPPKNTGSPEAPDSYSFIRPPVHP